MTTPMPASTPTPQPFARVAIGIDFSASSDGALLLARSRFPGAERLLIHVVDVRAAATPDISGAGLVPMMASPDLINTLTQVDKSRLDKLTEVGESHEIVSGDPASALVEAAQAWGADLIVVGSHQQGTIEHFFVGSVAEQVLKKSRLPVLVIKVGGHS
ncbi:universal stress protein [Deinococcus psychrotolerans]|uniref:Universal stress protein n=1 Tax=Deinococcus psychrotolerans TaxID=2489213 RepID=A0A3G8YHS3_9DEIO|nr:universal stress protein [Deinococcus psychrotolerans]AZI42034.1 universal stress protein [Deinococcus psychrotolerans]